MNRTKTILLAAIAILLAVLAAEQYLLSANIRIANAAGLTRQAWEYKQVEFALFGISGDTTVSANGWYEDGVTQSTPYPGTTSVFNRLGPQGWELVSAVPISDFAGLQGPEGYHLQPQGATSQVLLIFKRPKQ